MRTEHEIRQTIEKLIPNTDSAISIKEISLGDIHDPESAHYIVTLYGGLNGCGEFFDYLKDVQYIVLHLEGAWLIDWINDCPDDVWVLRIGVR
jgi:hypothetical protein